MAIVPTSGGLNALGQAVQVERNVVGLVATSKKEANNLIRAALEAAGRDFKAKYVKLRFGPYIRRSPWFYRNQKPTSKALKASGIRKDGMPGTGVGGKGELYRRVMGIFQRECDGWNPWADPGPPMSLVNKFQQMNPDRYNFSVTGLFKSRLAGMRKYYKMRCREAFNNLQADGHIVPLVLTGDLRRTATDPSRGYPKATATANKFRLVIPVPYPGPRAAKTAEYIGTVSEAEERDMARMFERHVARLLDLAYVPA